MNDIYYAYAFADTKILIVKKFPLDLFEQNTHLV